MTAEVTREVPIVGMDCAECSLHVQRAIAALPGVKSVEVLLGAEKAIIRLDPTRVDLPAIQSAVENAGYSVGASTSVAPAKAIRQDFTRPVLALLGLLFGVILFIIVVGEWLGLFQTLTRRLPWLAGLAIVLIGGYPVFRKVLLAALRKQVIAHTLMTVGVIAAALAGEWATAAVVVFFMRVGDYVERFTAERARRAIKDLTALAPQTARVERDGREIELPVAQVSVGEIVVVRPGEKIPVDGEVIAGHAVVDQSTITGEAMPVEAGIGAQVYAATIASQGSLKLRATRIGWDTTFGKVIRMVEEAEANRSDVQRLADRFAGYFLPVVALIAALTFLIGRNPMSVVAVLVVACSCSFALATPIAMLASIGAAARRGLLIKGGKYLELLARADVLLIDKTGTLTLGKPRITAVYAREQFAQQEEIARALDERTLFALQELPDTGSALASQSLTAAQRALLQFAASAERYSEHPLAEAVRAAAHQAGLTLLEPLDFEAYPGVGVLACVNGNRVAVGNRRILDRFSADGSALLAVGAALEARGKTLMYVLVDEVVSGIILAEDTLRGEVPECIQELRQLGIRHIEVLTGDNTPAAAALAVKIGVGYRAGLLPEEKMAIVREYQRHGHTVVMVGDGVNDAPSLAQADVGIAMAAAGSEVAAEAAHIALMRDDWSLVPQAVRIARRTLGVVKSNIWFTVVYNLMGLSLAAFGLLPPVLAAAFQSIPDLGILANSSRLLKQQ